MAEVKIANLDTAGKLDIIARQGDTFELVMTFLDGNNAALDLTGITKKMQVRLGKAIYLEFTEANGGIINTDINILTFYKTAPMMELNVNQYEYDLQFTYPDTRVRTMTKGFFTVQKQITK
jgi:hypothetical protein